MGKLRIVAKKSADKSKKINPKQLLEEHYLNRLESELYEEEIPLFDTKELLNIDDEYLSLPSDITDVDSVELGRYLSTFTQQKVYVRTTLSRAELQLELQRRKYSEVHIPVYKEYLGEKLSETAKEKLVNSDERVIDEYYAYIDLKEKVSMLEGVISNIEDVIFLISREVSRRSRDFSEENREHNVTRR